jgi:hypothetical protein
MHRSLAVVSLLALLAVACSAGTDGPPPTTSADSSAANRADDADDDGAARPTSSSPGTPREPIRATAEGCDAGEFHWRQANCEPAHSIPLDQIIAGGPPPDGIPPIDAPIYESIEEASAWLDDTSPVMVVDVEGDVRAYPLAILTWHEIVNDTVGGVPLVITYCPLCNSALVFERTIEGPDGEEVLDFGTSGRLYLSNLVMYDRQHLNLWTQFEGEGVVGETFLGTQLTRVPAWLFGFAELTELHPDAQVLSRDTGYNRDYGRNPYTGYDAEDGNPFLFRGELDDRFPPMTRLVGLAGVDDAVAVTLDLLTEQRSVEAELDGRPVVVLWGPGQASALDTGSIDAGRDVGQTAAFIAELDGQQLTLEPSETDGRFTDAETGSTFDLRGRALDGPLEGSQLEAIPHDDTFWFVWVAFRPDTELVGS